MVTNLSLIKLLWDLLFIKSVIDILILFTLFTLFEYNKLVACASEYIMDNKAYSINSNSQPGLSPSIIFILFYFIVILGFVYEFFKGSLDWTNNNFIKN